MNRKFKYLFMSLLIIILVCVSLYYINNGIEYNREMKAEKAVETYLNSKGLSKYNDYKMAIEKTDREIASLRLNQIVWVIFENEPTLIYKFIFNTGDELHIIEINDLSINKNVTRGKNGFSVDDENYKDKPLYTFQ